jgi:hypothetical protein
LPQFDKYGFHCTTNVGALTWSQIQNEISNTRPIVFVWQLSDNTAHMMVATGFYTSNGVDYVQINDPWPANKGQSRVLPYSDYVSGSDYQGCDYQHGIDIYGITTQSVPVVAQLRALESHSALSQEHVATQRAFELTGPTRAALSKLNNIKNSSLEESRAYSYSTAAESFEPPTLKLGSPFPVYPVSVASLRRYSTEADPMTILGTPRRVIFPVLANRRLSTSITVESTNNGWVANNPSPDELTQLFVKVRDASVSKTDMDATNYFAIQAFRQKFVAFKSHNQLMLIPTTDSPTFALKSGQPTPAREVFGVMATIAKVYNGLPM